MGLPLAAKFASSGFEVIGCDINPSVLELINSGKPSFEGEPGLAEMVGSAVASGRLTAEADTSSATSRSQVVVVVVPLLVDARGRPDFSALDQACSAVGAGLKPGTLVCFETTMPVGSTRLRMKPILERLSGLDAGSDFYLAFSPERVSSGRVFSDLSRYPKLVGGIDRLSEAKAVDFYASVLDFADRADLDRPNGVWDLGSCEAAEFAKLAETTYRDVNIGLANQFALYAESQGIDIHKIVEACNSQPFSHIHQPGIAVGGHCIPVYPHLYLLGDPKASVVKAAREANAEMPARVMDRLSDHLGSLAGLQVAILGLAYRGGVKEHAFSGAWALVADLKARGAIPLVGDPMYSREEILALGLTPLDEGAQADAVIIQTNHGEYIHLAQAQFPNARVFVDGRNHAGEGLKSPRAYLNLGVG